MPFENNALASHRRRITNQEAIAMDHPELTLAERVAEAAIAFHRERTGHAPRSATVVLSGDTLVITLHEAISDSERAMASDSASAARVQAHHRELFAEGADSLRLEIQRITGVAVGQSMVEVEPESGAVVHAFTTGPTVRVFQLNRSNLQTLAALTRDATNRVQARVNPQ